MFKKITLACVSTLMLAAASGAWAQAYPAKPVKLLVGFPAGGGLDVLARIIGQRVSEQWGQQIIVENKPVRAATSQAKSLRKARRTATRCYTPTSRS